MSLHLNFRGTFTNSGGHTKSFKFLPAKLNKFPEISVNFFYLNLSSMSIVLGREGRSVDDSEVVSTIALVLNSPANFTISILK